MSSTVGLHLTEPMGELSLTDVRCRLKGARWCRVSMVWAFRMRSGVELIDTPMLRGSDRVTFLTPSSGSDGLLISFISIASDPLLAGGFPPSNHPSVSSSPSSAYVFDIHSETGSPASIASACSPPSSLESTLFPHSCPVHKATISGFAKREMTSSARR